MGALALGPAPPQSSVTRWVRPYTLLAPLPGFSALRVPARFAMLASLCLGTAAGLAFARLAPARGTARRIAAAAAIAGLAADGWMRSMPLAAPPGRALLPRGSDAVVLELPANEGAVDTAAMYRSMLHRRPLVNGYSGHTPPHYAILSLALRRLDPSVIVELARGQPLVIVVNAGYDPGGRLQRMVEGIPGIHAHGGSSGGLIFELPAGASARVAPVGEAWPASVQETTGAGAEIDLGQTRVVRTIGFPLRWHYGELDRRMAVETSTHRTQWSTVWEDWTGGPAFAAALVNPIEAPVRLTLPDVRVRYLRIHPAPRWMRNEIRVYGPR
jgi:hypothetical protein